MIEQFKQSIARMYPADQPDHLSTGLERQTVSDKIKIIRANLANLSLHEEADLLRELDSLYGRISAEVNDNRNPSFWKHWFMPGRGLISFRGELGVFILELTGRYLPDDRGLIRSQPWQTARLAQDFTEILTVPEAQSDERLQLVRTVQRCVQSILSKGLQLDWLVDQEWCTLEHVKALLLNSEASLNTREGLSALENTLVKGKNDIALFLFTKIPETSVQRIHSRRLPALITLLKESRSLEIIQAALQKSRALQLVTIGWSPLRELCENAGWKETTRDLPVAELVTLRDAHHLSYMAWAARVGDVSALDRFREHKPELLDALKTPNSLLMAAEAGQAQFITKAAEILNDEAEVAKLLIANSASDELSVVSKVCHGGKADILTALKRVLPSHFKELLRIPVNGVAPLLGGIRQHSAALISWLSENYGSDSLISELCRQPDRYFREGLLTPEARKTICDYVKEAVPKGGAEMVSRLGTALLFACPDLMNDLQPFIEALVRNQEYLPVALRVAPILVKQLLTYPDQDGLGLVHRNARTGDQRIFDLLSRMDNPALVDDLLQWQDQYGDSVAKHAALQDNGELFKRLGQERLNALLDRPNEWSPLHLAALRGNSSILAAFAQNLSQDRLRQALETRNDMDETVLVTAATYAGDRATPFIETLLGSLQDPTTADELLRAKDKDGQTIVHIAAHDGNIALLTSLQTKYPTAFQAMIRETDFAGTSPLLLAVALQREPAISVICEAAHIPGLAPILVDAARVNPEEVVKEKRLTQTGATLVTSYLIEEIRKPDADVWNLLEAPSLLGDEEILKRVLKEVKPQTQALLRDREKLTIGLREHPDLVKQILTQQDANGEIQINIEAADANSILFERLNAEDALLLQQLLLSARNKDGSGPAHAAALVGNWKFFEEMPPFRLFAVLALQNNQGATPLFAIGAGARLLPILKAAVDHDPRTRAIRLRDLNRILRLTTRHGDNLAHRAVAQVDLALLKALRGHDESLFLELMWAQNSDGHTPMAKAIAENKSTIVRFFCKEFATKYGFLELPSLMDSYWGNNGQLQSDWADLVAIPLADAMRDTHPLSLDLLNIPILMGSSPLRNEILNLLEQEIDQLLLNEEAFRKVLKHPYAMALFNVNPRTDRSAFDRAAETGNTLPFEVLADVKPEWLEELLVADHCHVLHMAVDAQKPEIFRALHAKDPALLDAPSRIKDPYGTLLEDAERQGFDGVVKELLLLIELPRLTSEVNHLLELLGKPLLDMPAAQEVAALRQAFQERKALIATLRTDLRAKQVEARAANQKPPLLLPTHAELAASTLKPEHLQAGIAKDKIPTADPAIRFEKLIDYLDKLKKKLPAEVMDEGTTRRRDEILSRFRDTFQRLARDQVVMDHYGNVLTDSFKEQIVNVLRHLTKVFEERDRESQGDPIKQAAFEKEVIFCLFEELGVGFFHCLDRTSTVCEDLYFDHIAAPGGTSHRDAKSLPNRLFLKLLKHRRNLFQEAVSHVKADAHVASTHRYYRTRMADEFGLGSNEMSAESSTYAGFAVKGQEGRIRAEFNAAYKPVEYITQLVNDPAEKELSSELVEAWFLQHYKVADKHRDLLLPDGSWNPAAIAIMLQDEGVIAM